MLFTTVPFALLFLPLTLLGFFAWARVSHAAAAAWLLVASLFFYGFWMPEFTLLLVGSIACNFALGLRLVRQPLGQRGRWLTAGVVFNLGLLGYFKYANFFVSSLNSATGWQLPGAEVVLPIGISFYTFTQIAFLVDVSRGKVQEVNPVHYGLFVTYFPHLIAGPVLHHGQMMPQFAQDATYRPQPRRLAVGLAIFALGLIKKVVLADGIAPYADAVFTPADAGLLPSTPEAWLAAVAYTLQLYFDFSGYSDMAIGLSLLFNVRLPFNFDSPYQARSISDFWRRWHISLSTFLRDYLYIALGGNRHGAVRRYANLAITMVLGGLWHGASWTFVVWGALHGLYLMVNHGFRAALGEARCAWLATQRWFSASSWALTLVAVVVAWVFFRATSFEGAGRMLTAMAGQGGSPQALWNAGLQASVGWLWCAVLGALALWAPNSNRIGQWLEARAASATIAWWVGTWGLAVALLMVLLNTVRDSVSAFIYFNF